MLFAAFPGLPITLPMLLEGLLFVCFYAVVVGSLAAVVASVRQRCREGGDPLQFTILELLMAMFVCGAFCAFGLAMPDRLNLPWPFIAFSPWVTKAIFWIFTAFLGISLGVQTTRRSCSG